jgi:glyoxylase-like metal-dependent hydrolase (beta-lactamase superfamily II)
MSQSSTDTRPERSEQRAATNEITELAPGVLRSQLPVQLPGLGHVNCYMLQDGDGVTLVDPGLPGEQAWQALVDRLKRADYSVGDVHTVIVTHSHYDHYGGAERLREEAGARIVAHRDLMNRMAPPDIDDDAEFIDVDGEVKRGRGETGFGRVTPWGTWSEPPVEVVDHWQQLGIGVGIEFPQAPRPDIALGDAQQITLAGRPWVAVHTPGHTADHLCLYDAEHGLMLTGDHVLPTITPHISGFADGEAPLKKFMDSLQRMHDFSDVTLAMPAHGDPFTDLTGRADHICGHHLERLDDFREAAAELETASVNAYMRRAFKERSWGGMAESETYAHLDHLRDHGELDTTWVDGLLHFTTPGL